MAITDEFIPSKSHWRGWSFSSLEVTMRITLYASTTFSISDQFSSGECDIHGKTPFVFLHKLKCLLHLDECLFVLKDQLLAKSKPHGRGNQFLR